MVFRALLRLLMGHPQVSGALIQRLSETRPIRSAARMTAYLFLRGKQALEEGVKEPAGKAIKDAASKTDLDANRFARTFRHEINKGLEELRRQKK